MATTFPSRELEVAFRAREKAILELLTLCAQKELDIPDDLRNAVLGEEIHQKCMEERSEREPNVITSLVSERASNLASMEDDELMKEVRSNWEKLKAEPQSFNCRIVDGSYTVTIHTENNPSTSNTGDVEVEQGGSLRAKQRIDTVITASPIYALFHRIYRSFKTKGHAMISDSRPIMEGINLNFDSGKMYLVLGAPGSGKSTLLKMIANTLRQDKDHVVGGTVSINGYEPTDPGIMWTNLTVHIDQIDRLHPYLTVSETLEFAWNCRSGGTHMKAYFGDDETVKKVVEQMNEQHYMVNKVMEGCGLTRVKDTFVGDQSTVRGVSGGEKKRVTVAEMNTIGAPLICCDEISTGLDAATTFDITKLMLAVSRLTGGIKIVSLLQPPPETVALFDELILISKGRVIYSGPIDMVVSHFEGLGYKMPDRVDVADWLQTLPTPEGAKYLVDQRARESHLSTDGFKRKFDESLMGQAIKENNEAPLLDKFKIKDVDILKKRYQNGSYRSMKLLLNRELLLWWRDKYQIKARVAQDLVMGIIAGTLFWQQSDNPQSVMGILFQSMFFICVGAMIKIPGQFEPRGIFYKHQDANFFPTWSFVLGRSFAAFPTSLIDGIIYGSIIYWFVGLPYNDGASIANFFIFMLLCLLASLVSGLIFSVFSATVKDKTTAQAAMAVTIVLLVLFSGFTVQPDVIPPYWIWAYWINMFAWILRGLVVNTYQSGKFDEVQENGNTEGENILIQFGFLFNGEPFTFVWVWYGILFSIAAGLLSVGLSTYFLSSWRFETGKGVGTDIPDEPENANGVDCEKVNIPYQKVNLTFKSVHYTVKASTSDDELELLKGIDGYIEAGKMTALMGSSGAGKTTLMDCLSLRKTSGKLSGEVMLNGHPQDPLSFRRCTGYVEQFDVQSPNQTIRETVDFSAKLRLDENDPAVTEESITSFVDQTLAMLELTTSQDLLIGSDLTGGLSFEQKKRLSIAVELVSNPSILFLDEPTSGLDARAAGIVMRGLKRIANSGRAVCATIHQPSIAIFNDFDTLLLLKRGGEVVFFGELGDESCMLIQYFERYERTAQIRPGENPATWMLTTIGAGSSSTSTEKPFDYVGCYAESTLRANCLKKIDEFTANPVDANKVVFLNKFATSFKTQRTVVLKRVVSIYWRSASYNTIRLMVSAIVAFLFGSVYASQRVPENESDMNSRVTSIYVTFVFLAVNAFNTVLAIFETERNMFYRHKAALMYSERSIILSFTLAEIPFILLASMVFCVCFYFLVGFSPLAYKFFLYYLFFTLNLGLFTFLGQMMMSLVRDSQTAQGFGGLLIALTSMFAGVLIRPQNISGFWVFMYWLMPGHYVLEGLIASQFHEDGTSIVATTGSSFYYYLGCNSNTPSGQCEGTAEDWIFVSFGGKFSWDNIPYCVLYLVLLIIAARTINYFALQKLNYLAK